jgi:hypothetical protein
MAAVSEKLSRPQVLAALEDLAAQRASGVFEVTGNPSGGVYLDDGRIAFARATWVPGPAARLRAMWPALRGPADRDGDDIAVAGLAVQRGYLTAAGLARLLRSVVVDAFLVLTVPLTGDSAVTAIRFTSTRTYWTEMFPRLGLDPVREEALARASLIAGYGLSPTVAVAPRDLTAPVTVLSREQWAAACRLGDRASARDIAMRCGSALSDAVACLGDLIRAGLCAPVPASGGAPAPVPARAEPAARAEPPAASAALPARHPGATLPGQPSGWRQQPTADILHQVLSGLRKLS